jgi:hypothetical protein
MGAPTSATLSEIYLLFLGHNNICNLLNVHQILGYFRYADDILILYDLRNTDIDKTLLHFNKMHPSLKFTTEKGKNKIRFVDITINREREKPTFLMYLPKTYHYRP